MLELAPSITLLHSEKEHVNARKEFLVEGYLITKLNEGPNKFQVTINCNHSFFLNCLKYLISITPYPFITFIGEFSKLKQLDGEYYSDQILEVINNNQDFIRDCTNLEMAFDYLDETQAFQLYVSDCKFFEVFTDDLSFIMHLENEFNIQHVEKMVIISEFPRTMTSMPSDEVNANIHKITDTLLKND